VSVSCACAELHCNPKYLFELVALPDKGCLALGLFVLYVSAVAARLLLLQCST
jgi:hypothetical protein